MSQVSPVPPGPAPVLWWTREFPGSREQARQARRWLEELLPACTQLEELTLLVSELVTNAIVHTASGQPGGRFGLTVEWSPSVVRALVMDQGSPAASEIRTGAGGVAWDAENGRGLFLVDQLADDWGAVSLPGGRLVWLEMAWAAAGGPPLEVPGGYQAAVRDAVVLRGEFPATTIWWGHRSQCWWAALPGAIGEAGLVHAPTLPMLSAVLAATVRQPEAGAGRVAGSYAAARNGDRGAR